MLITTVTLYCEKAEMRAWLMHTRPAPGPEDRAIWIPVGAWRSLVRLRPTVQMGDVGTGKEPWRPCRVELSRRFAKGHKLGRWEGKVKSKRAKVKSLTAD